MQQRWMRIGIGIFVALALVLLGTLIVLFNSLPRLFVATNVYTARFKDATGLSPGAAVLRSGVPIGVVGDMKLDDQTGEVNAQVDLDGAAHDPQGRTADTGDQPARRRGGHRSGSGPAAGGSGPGSNAAAAGHGAGRRPGQQRQPAHPQRLRRGADHAGNAQRHPQVDAAHRKDDAAGRRRLPRVPRLRPVAQQLRARPAPHQRRRGQAGAVGQRRRAPG